MSKTVTFFHDLASPNAYLANHVLKDIAARTGATIKYHPTLLGGVFKSTGNQAPWMTFAEVPAKLNYMRVEMDRFIKRYGLTKFQMNPHFPLNTLVLSRAAVAADMNGELEKFIDAGQQLVSGHELADDRLPRRQVETGRHADEHRHGDVGAGLTHAGEPHRHQTEGDERLQRLGDEEDGSPAVPVGDRAAVGPHDRHRHDLGEPREADPARTAREVEHDQRDGEGLEPASDVGGQAPEPEQPIVPDPEDGEALP